MQVEKYPDIYILASRREKQIKKWNRAWKCELIEKMKPDDVFVWLVEPEAGSPLARG